MDTPPKSIRRRPYKPKGPKLPREAKARFNPIGFYGGEQAPPPPPPPRPGGPVITFEAPSSWTPEARPDDCPERAAFIDSIVARRRK